jgi:hypothetical protein
MKEIVYLTIELGKMMKIHYMRNSALPNWGEVFEYLYTSAGLNINKEIYPEDTALGVYGYMCLLKHHGKEIW